VIRQVRRGKCAAGARSLRQGMRSADHGHHLNGAKRLHRNARMPEMLACKNAQCVRAGQQRVDRSAQGQHRDTHRHRGIRGAHVVQRRASPFDRKERIHHQRKLQLDAFAQALRASAHRIDPQQDVAGVGKQRLALRRHDGTMAGAVEQRHAQLRLHVGNGVADGGLHTGQAAGGRAKAAGICDGGEHTQLVQGQRVNHGKVDLFF